MREHNSSELRKLMLSSRGTDHVTMVSLMISQLLLEKDIPIITDFFLMNPKQLLDKSILGQNY